jgi:peptide/nickel transport system substrate-binding protein
MKYRRWTALAAASLLALAACGGDDDSEGDDTTAATSATTAAADTTTGESPDTTAAEEATTTTAAESPTTTAAPDMGEDCTATVAGSELDFGVYAPASSLDPLQNSGALVGGTDMLAIYDALMRWNPDTNEWEPHVAESLESNADFTEWTLTLRAGVTYSNGDPMVAQDVLDNMTRMMGQGRNASRGMIARVDLANSTAPDESTVVFKLFKPWSNFGYLLADAPGMVVNPEVGAVVDSAGASVISTDPTGAGVGPYSVERFAPGESPYLVLKARPDYWGGAPCIETVNLINIPTDQPKLDALELGELDVAFLRTQNVIEEARESGEFDEKMELQSAGVLMLINQGVGTFNPITADPRFRQAVNAAIDTEALSQRAYGGELLQQAGFVHPDSYWYTEGAPEPERDPALATQLVDELKAEGWDGNIRLVCPDTVPDAPVAFEAALEAVGMSVDSQVTDTNTHIAAVAVNKDFDMACWGLNISDSAIWRQIGFNFASDSPSNRIGYKNPAFDAAIDELYAAPDDDARRAAVLKMSEIYAEDVPVAIVGAAEEGILISPSVTGIVQTQQTMFMFQDASITQ